MKPQRLTRHAALGLAVAALAVPASAAAQDLRSPDARDGAPVTRAADDLRSPDAQSTAVPEIVYTAGDLRSPDSRDAGAGRGTFSAPDVMVVELDKPVPAPATAADGIDWADAGIGAAGLLAVAGIALAAFVLAQRRSGARIA